MSGPPSPFGFSSRAIPRAAPTGSQYCLSRQFRTNTNMKYDPSVSAENHEEMSRFTNDESNPAANDYWMAVMSDLAYRLPNDIAQELRTHWGVTSFRYIAGRSMIPPVDAQILIVKISHDPRFDVPSFMSPDGTTVPASRSVEDMAIVAFRGTIVTSLTSLVTDFRDAAKVFMGNGPSQELGFVHAGFRDSIDHVWPTLLKEVKALKVPIWFTGHSMGASLATLAAARFMTLGDPDVKVAGLYTYGGPREGLYDFVQSFTNLITSNRVHVRVHAYADDPVTVIPGPMTSVIGGSLEAIVKGGWKHIGLSGSSLEHAVWFKDDGTVGADDETNQRFNMNLSDFPGINKLQGVTHHAVRNYVLAAETAAFGSSTACN